MKHHLYPASFPFSCPKLVCLFYWLWLIVLTNTVSYGQNVTSIPFSKEGRFAALSSRPQDRLQPETSTDGWPHKAVIQDCQPITITEQPASFSSVEVGERVTVSVKVDGTGPFTYQWYGIGLTGVASATTATLTIDNLPSDLYRYWVVVSNNCSSVTSQELKLYVSGPYHPYLKRIITDSLPTTGGTSMTLIGGNFTTYDPRFPVPSKIDPKVYLNNSSYITTSSEIISINDSIIQCILPPGQGRYLVEVQILGNYTFQNLYLFYDAPVITQVSSSSGSTLGGAELVLTGSNFSNPALLDRLSDDFAVTIGGRNAKVISHDHTKLVIITPPGDPGQSSIQAEVANQISNRIPFTYVAPAPSLKALSMNHGATSGGESLTLTGTNFGLSTGQVTVGINATPIIRWTDTLIVYQSPAGQGINIPVSVETSDKVTSNSVPFNYDAPKLNTISPDSGLATGGTSVTLTGTNFGLKAQVSFGNSSATVVSQSHTQLVVRTPPGQMGIEEVVVQVEQTSNALSFTYMAPPSPILTNLKPNHGPTAGGAPVAISGSKLGSRPGSITLGASPLSITSWSDTLVQAILPAGQGINQPLLVVRADGQESKALSFSYDAPILTSLSPTHGPTNGLTSLTLTGTNFGTIGTVRIGEINAPIVGQYAHSSVVVSVPAGQGVNLPVAITVSGQTSSQHISFSYDAPVIDSLSPSHGPTSGETLLTLYGRNLGTSGKVLVGGKEARLTASGWSHNQISVRLPAGQGAGQSVWVTRSDEQTSNSVTFNYDAPALSRLNPASGVATGGTSVTLTGTSFGQDAQVSFGNSSATVISRSHTQLVVTSPPGQLGLQPVTVTVVGQTSNPLNFSYTAPPAPVLTTLSPNHGPTSGGTSLTLVGNHFGSRSGQVSLNGTALSITSWLDTQVQCILVAGQGSGQSLVLTRADGLVSNPLSFSYDAPMVAQLSPASGLSTGGTSVTLTGANFGQSAQVSFGSTSATVVSQSHTQLVVISPPGQVGPQAVVVSVGSLTASPRSFTYLASSIAVKVQSLDGDNGQTSNNSINPTLRLVNTGSSPISYTDLTVRYWFTAENYAGINTWIDYAQMGSNRVRMNYVRLDKPYQGADGYIEYSFDASAGNLPLGGNSGSIQSRLANQNWAVFNELDDYSYQSTNAYLDNAHITVYRTVVGSIPQLLWGTEPIPAPLITKLVVQSENKNATTTGNQISTYLKINNQGNTAVNYGDLTMRYWLTEEGTARLNYWIDYAELGASRITGQFVKVTPVRTGADIYLEFAFRSSLGTLNPQSGTGSIQFRVAKADWSSFNEANDYSYRPSGPAADNPQITLYNKGQLVYGTEPSSGARLTAEKETDGFKIMVLNNPTHADQAEINVIGAQGQRLHLTMTDWQGRLIDEQHQEAVAPVERYTLNFQKGTAGLYILRVSSATESRSVKLVKVN